MTYMLKRTCHFLINEKMSSLACCCGRRGIKPSYWKIINFGLAALSHYPIVDYIRSTLTALYIMFYFSLIQL